jgi:hypothetical protein
MRKFGADSRIHSIVFSTPAPDFDAPAGSVWVNVTVDSDDGHGGLAYAFWEASLAVAGLQETHAAQGLPLIAGESFTAVLPSGSTIPLGSSVIPPSVSAASPESGPLLADAKSAAAAQGLHVAHAGVITAGRGPGVYIDATTDDPQQLIENRSAITLAIFGSYYDRRKGADGFYLEVRDRAGALVTAAAYATQTGEGAAWADPKYGPPPDVAGLNAS